MPLANVLTNHWGEPGVDTLAGYQQRGGYGSLRKALELAPAQVVDEVKRSNLRGRGGAGFPTGLKWSFLPKDDPRPRYLCVNGDESEPGTFKDRYCIEKSPHQLLEGIAITAWAIGAHTAYVYLRGELATQARILERAIDEAREAGILGPKLCGRDFALEVHVHLGAGAYICGEETALLESLEGKKGWPRLKPPFPAVSGLFGCPTIVNNVETLATVPAILAMGGERYAALGTEKSGGTRLVSVSGAVRKPGVYEITLDTTFRQIVEEICGGVPGGRKVKAVIPGGSSCPVLTAEQLDVAAEYEALKAIGSMAGSGGVVVLDESTCMVRVAWRIARFYAEESCGQCTPCREGTPWMARILRHLEEGRAAEGDLALLKGLTGSILGRTLCPLGDAAAMPVRAFLDKFRAEFEAHLRERRCPFPHPWGEQADELFAGAGRGET
ncbi:MAG TPA: NADH-quinone oxidoreductase subunit F [Myxococcales bacterium]|nr:NADH-quinone oxidoreductase subunit F [Myxococcales bacterium]